MPRKPKSRYHLRPDGRYEAKRRYKGNVKHFYGASDREIDAKIQEWKAQIDDGRAGKIRLFEEVAADWWEKTEPKISPNTVGGYLAGKKKALQEFEGVPVNEITSQEIYLWLERLAAQDYSQKVISNTKSVMRRILNEAFIAGEIQSNPCVGLPFVKGKPRDPRKPTDQEDMDIIEASKNSSDMARMSYFMLYTGCRRGEAAALQYKHIDRKHRTATIAQAVAYGQNSRKPILKLPKTEAGKRKVDLYDNVLEVLPDGKDPEEYVFFPKGLPTKTDLETGLRRYQAENGIKSTAHQLRHAYASMGHSANISAKDMQHRLGHANISTTQDIYTDLEEIYNDEVRQKMNEYIQERIKSRKTKVVKKSSDTA